MGDLTELPSPSRLVDRAIAEQGSPGVWMLHEAAIRIQQAQNLIDPPENSDELVCAAHALLVAAEYMRRAVA